MIYLRLVQTPANSKDCEFQKVEKEKKEQDSAQSINCTIAEQAEKHCSNLTLDLCKRFGGLVKLELNRCRLLIAHLEEPLCKDTLY